MLHVVVADIAKAHVVVGLMEDHLDRTAYTLLKVFRHEFVGSRKLGVHSI